MTTRLESAVPPDEMRKDSVGTMVNVWLMVMQIWARTHQVIFDGFVFDGVFGDKSVSLTKAFQNAHGLKADGGVGLATRAKAKEVLGFDFNAVAIAMPSDTIFVGSDGEQILWVPTRARANATLA